MNGPLIHRGHTKTSGLCALGAILCQVSAILISVSARADTAYVAVAANFTEAAKEITQAFEAQSGHGLVLSFGSSGQLYTQITQDAPFEVFLAADAVRPQRAVDEGYGVPGSVVTYAVGRLVVWSADGGYVRGPAVLASGDYSRLAIANPRTAPYGAAAVQVLQRLGAWEGAAPRIVEGNTVAQVHQFVDTGNAEIGFLPLSLTIGRRDGSHWLVPPDLHDPIRQDAVLLTKGVGNPAAEGFMAFLGGPAASAIIERFGYATGSDEAAP